MRLRRRTSPLLLALFLLTPLAPVASAFVGVSAAAADAVEPALPIPSGAPAMTSGSMVPATVVVTDARPIYDVDIAIRVQHTAAADLDIVVVHPDGTRIELSTDNGAGANYGAGNPDCSGDLTVFDSFAGTAVTNATSPAAGRFRPEESLSLLNDKPANGTWQLLIDDDAAADWGSLLCFEVRLAADKSLPVTTTADVVDPVDGLTSLREAFTMAADDEAPTTIELASGATYQLQCTVAGDEQGNVEGDLDMRKVREYLTVDGHGSTISVAGCGDERVIDISAVKQVTLRDVTLLGGRGQDVGGALRVGSTTRIVLDGLQVHGTVTTDVPTCTGECLARAAVSLEATADIQITDTSITDNATRMETCVTLCVGVGGLWVSGSARLTLTRTDISRNGVTFAACSRGCVVVGGADLRAESAHLDSVAITGNQAILSAPDCGRCTSSGGLLLGAGTRIVNSTVSDNVASPAEVHSVGGILHLAGSLQLAFSTVVDNTSPAVMNLFVATPEPVDVIGSVVGSASGASGCDIRTAIPTVAHSFESGTGCFPSGAGATANGGDPRLGSATPAAPWRAPVAGSPLIDAVPTASCLGQDQTGRSRPIGAGCDIGAIEVDPSAAPPPGAGLDAARFVAVTPARVFDTRPGSDGAGPKGLVGAGESIDVQVTGVAGVPSTGVAAIVLNVTATEPAASGFVTVWPTGTLRPEASSLNLTGSGQTRANLVTVPVSPDGKVSLFAEAGTHLLADVAGYFESVDAAQSAGRIVTVSPTRLFDTRRGDPPAAPQGVVGADEVLTVRVAGNAGVPASGASAVVLNVTATDAVGGGYVTAWPSGGPRPLASILNLNAPGDTAPNLVMVPLGADGSIQLYTSAGAHLLADVTGYVTDATAAASTAGLFVPLSPTRVFDTRPEAAAAGPKGLVPADSSITTAFAGVAAVPPDAAGVVINLTATGAVTSGFVSSWPSGTPRPLASTLNVVDGDTRANAAILPLGSGRLDHYSLPSTHLLADVAGYLLS